MRRVGGSALVKNEVKVLRAAIELVRRGQSEFHGYGLATLLADLEESGSLTNQSALYRALRRLEKQGALTSRWEDPEEAASEGREGRPRRYYEVSAAGVALARYELERLHGPASEW